MLARITDLDQLEGMAIIVAAVPYIGDPFLSFRRGAQALDIHAKKARVKIDTPIEIADEHHRVPDAKSNIIYSFLSAHFIVSFDVLPSCKKDFLSASRLPYSINEGQAEEVG
jgi:hypothetical protein